MATNKNGFEANMRVCGFLSGPYASKNKQKYLQFTGVGGAGDWARGRGGGLGRGRGLLQAVHDIRDRFTL